MLRKKCIPERGRKETLLIRRLTWEFWEDRTKVREREREKERKDFFNMCLRIFLEDILKKEEKGRLSLQHTIISTKLKKTRMSLCENTSFFSNVKTVLYCHIFLRFFPLQPVPIFGTGWVVSERERRKAFCFLNFRFNPMGCRVSRIK